MDDETYSKQMDGLKEEKLLLKGFLFFLLPSITIVLLSLEFKYVYLVIPVYESRNCLCHLFEFNN